MEEISQEVPETAVTDTDSAPVQEESHSEPQKEDYVSRLEYNKAMEMHRKDQRELQELNQYREQMTPWEEFAQVLKSDPAKLQKVIQVLQDEEDQKQAEDPYAGWDEESAKKMRELDDLRQWKDNLEKGLAERQQALEESNIKAAQESATDHFFELLEKDGLISKGASTEELMESRLIKSISKAVLGELIEISNDPYKPTLKEVKLAYQNVKDGLSEYEKHNLKRKVTEQLPPTGSKSGVPVGSSKSFNTDEDRIKHIVNQVSGW